MITIPNIILFVDTGIIFKFENITN